MVTDQAERARERRERKADAVRRYREEHPGREDMERFYEIHPGYRAVHAAEYRKTLKGKASRAKAMIKYYLTPKGRARKARNMARNAARRRERSTDSEAYGARVEMLHIMQESCAKCEAPFKVTHQIDHILALCLGGTDNWNNLQPLCIRCHRKKSAEDTAKFRKAIASQGGKVQRYKRIKLVGSAFLTQENS